jgi:hypothetical protein
MLTIRVKLRPVVKFWSHKLVATVNVTFSPVVPSDQVSQRVLTWTDGTTVSTVTLDPSATAASLTTASDGDTVQASIVDTNVVGNSQPSNTLSVVVPTLPTAVPTTPAMLTITATP